MLAKQDRKVVLNRYMVSFYYSERLHSNGSLTPATVYTAVSMFILRDMFLGQRTTSCAQNDNRRDFVL